MDSASMSGSTQKDKRREPPHRNRSSTYRLVEFIVGGSPLSWQTSNTTGLSQWKEKVKNAARENWSCPPTNNYAAIIVTFFCKEHSDVDNLGKTVTDALQGIIYANDNQMISTQYIRGRNRLGSPVDRRSREKDYVFNLYDQGPDFAWVKVWVKVEVQL